MVEMCEVVNFIRGPLALACQRASWMATSAEYRKYCQRRFPLSFNTMQYFPSAHPRFSSRRGVASASPRLLAMARTLGCLRPSGMFQDFSMRKRASSVRRLTFSSHFLGWRAAPRGAGCGEPSLPYWMRHYILHRSCNFPTMPKNISRLRITVA